MRATVLRRPGQIALADHPEPRIAEGNDAVVRVTTAAVRGSDPWRCRGEHPFGRPRRR